MYYNNTGANPDTDGTLYARNSRSTETQQRGGVYVGGPIIQDKLFMFGAVERIQNKRSGVAGTSETPIDNASTGWLDRKDVTTRYVGKVDWNITDSHRLEFTTIGDKPESDRYYSGYDYASNTRSGPVTSGGHYESIARSFTETLPVVSSCRFPL